MEKDMHVPDVLCVLAQVAPELVHELQRQSDEALEQLFGLVGLQWGGGSWRGAEREERVRRLVEHFGSALSAECARFVHALTLTCNLPLPLESQLVSAAGYDHEDSPQPPKRKRSLTADPVERLAAAMKADFLQRHERLCQGLVLPVRLGEVRVGLRKTGGRPREAEDGTMEHITTAEAFLTPRLGVTVLLGPPGSGKTVVTHCVAHHWAWDSLSCFRLLFLLEFRQLNVVAECLSLQQLLFGSCPRLSDKEADAVLAFVLNHPEQVCIIFDGYDEFCGRFLPSGTRDISHDPRRQLPVAELFSGLCGGTVLRGCSLLITCRARDLLDLPDSAVDHVGELLGFDRPGVMQFAQKYFQGKGHSEQALRHLLSSRHLLNMCSVPALCQICCICLDYLFSGECGGATPLPATITQVYVHSLVAFLSRAEGRGVGSQDTLLLQSYRAEVKELSRLALKGLDNGTIVFLAQDVQQDLHAFATAAGLLHPQELRWPDGPGVAGSVFVHLTVQEFLAALHLMTSEESTEAQLRQKLNLKSRWMTRCDPKSVFTDSIHLYLCGLAAPACAPYLQQLVGDSRAQLVRRRQTAVLKVLQQFAGSSSLTGPKVLELCRCAFESQDQALGQTVGLRCRFELRNIPLSPLDADALVFVISAGGRSVVLDFGGCSMDLECLEVLVTCQHISCLTFRSRKYDDRFAEAFAAVLPRLQNLRRLEFMGSSVTEAGAAKLASALKSCPHITELNLRDNVLSDRGIQHIANILPKMAGLTTVHLGKNGVSLDGVLCLMEKLVTCPVFRKLHVDSSLKDMKEIHLLFSPSHAPGEDPTVSLSNCRFTVDTMDRLCSVLAGCPALSAVQLSGGGVTDDTLQVLCESLPKLRVSRHIMLSCSSLTTDSLAGLGRSLAACAAVTEVNARLEDPPEVCVLFSRGRKTPSETMETLPLLSKKLRLTHCDLHPTHVDTLCQTLSGCPQLTLLDLSNNKLGNNGLKKLLDVLPQLSTIQEINTSNNGVTMDGVLLLVETLRTCRNLRDVDVSHGGEQRIIMKFHISKRWQQAKNPVAPLMMENGLHLLKKFSLQQTSVTPGSMNDLCRRLAQCTGLIQLDFSGGSLDRSSMERLLKHLPQMIRLKLLNLSGNLLGDEGIRHFVKLLPGLHTSASVRIDNNNLTQMGALHLVAAMSVCDQLVALEVSLGQEDRSTVQFALSSDYDLCQSLSLREWQFGDDHLQKLAEILPRCSRLEKLHLSCNKLPIELRVLLKTLSKLNALQSLEMENNGISAQVIEELLGELQCRLTHLDVRVVEPWLKAEAAVNLISSCLNLNPNIQHIRVEETTLSVTLEMRGGDQGKWCTELSISGADPDNTAPLVSSVKSIGLVDCSLQERHLLFLQSLCHKCPQLLELDLSHNSSGTEGADFLSSVLPGFRSLQKLSLDHHVIDDHAAAVLEKTLPQLPHLRTISLSHCSGFTVVGACHLVTAVSHCRLLQNISLQALQLEKEAVAYLATGLHSMTSVKQLVLSRVAVVTGSSAPLVVLPVLESLGKLQGIEVIELDEMWMGDQGVLELVKHLPTWTGLRRISLCNNYIADSLGASLVDALSNCTALEEIILSRNRLGDMTGCCLGQTLPLLSCIRVLDLQMNCLTAAGGAALISAFKVCRSLTDIVLSENHLGRVGMENLCAALPHMPSLRKLHLVSVGTPELSHLATSLGSCTCVEDVSFAWNEIGDEVAESLAEILPLCPRLKRVDLEFNSISVRGAEALAAGLHSSSSVQVIRLWKNPIATDELQKLSEKENRLSFSSM